MVKFKHCKIETNQTCSCTISLVHLDTQQLFIFYNECLSFSFFFSCVSFNIFYVIFSYLLSTESAKNVQNFIFSLKLEKLV